MSTFRFTPGPGMVDALVGVQGRLERGLDAGLEYLRAESMKQVPHQEGILQGTARTSRDGLTGAVSYDTPYAARQHEETEWQHKNGRKAKYLEDPMVQDRAGILRAIADAARFDK